ncbi:MAG: hypothetical protein IJV69_05475 [Kiritimatiellae bacterium]|nr:hypothetical protein [Kiritimatiellia bacterium]
MATITTQSLEPTTSGPLVAAGATYAFNQIDGLAFGELLLAVCLERANMLESMSVSTLTALEDRTLTLATYAEAAQMVLDGSSPESLMPLPPGYACTCGIASPTLEQFLHEELGLEIPPEPWSYSQQMTLYTQLQALMEPLNAQSEEALIDLQTLVNAQDAFYSLATQALTKIESSALNTAQHF